MRIAVFGTGGVGGNFGGQLARGGADVVFIARGAHLQALRDRGLRIDAGGDSHVVQPVQATDDPGQVGPVDAILVAVKAWQIKDAAETMRPMVGPETLVVPLQNGLDAPAELAAVLGQQRVLGGLCATISYLLGPGHVYGGGGQIIFGELDNRPSERAQRLLAACQQAGVGAEIPADIHAAMWRKFISITAWSGVGAVTRAPAGVWGAMPQTRQLFAAAVAEALAVSRAHGIAIPDEDADRTLALPDTIAPNATSSMQRDIMDGRPSELAYQNGAVVRLGQEVDVATPLHSFRIGN